MIFSLLVFFSMVSSTLAQLGAHAFLCTRTKGCVSTGKVYQTSNAKTLSTTVGASGGSFPVMGIVLIVVGVLMVVPAVAFAVIARKRSLSTSNMCNKRESIATITSPGLASRE